MIIGTGDIARTLQASGLDRPDWLFFASGVSHSGETRQAEFDREATLLWQQDKTRRVVYFSSLCVFYADTRYAAHKRAMENRVKQMFPRFCIVRLGNITWGRNPHTLINHLRDQFVNCQPVRLDDVYRYVISRDEFEHWLGLIPDWNCELNIPGRRLKVADIYREFVVEALAYA